MSAPSSRSPPISSRSPTCSARIGRTQGAQELGPRQVRRGADPGRQGPARWQDRRDAHPRRVRPGRVNLHTYTGWGPFPTGTRTSPTQMHGQGTFVDPRLERPKKFPVVARASSTHPKRSRPDDSKLAALHFYQLAIPAPRPPKGNFDAKRRRAGKAVFNGRRGARPVTSRRSSPNPAGPCTPAKEIGIDDFQSTRSPDERYRTTPLRGLFARAKGGFYHDGRFAELRSRGRWPRTGPSA